MAKEPTISFIDQEALNIKAKEESYYQDQPLSTHFCTIQKACGTKETGRNFPQVQKVIGGNFWDDGRSGSVRNLTYGDIPKEDFIDFGTLQLYKSSKVTDTISAVNPSSDGFYLSEFAMQIFSQFNLGEHKYYPVKVLHKEKYHNYVWLQLKTDLNSFIDFSKSEFFEEIGMINGIKKTIKVASVDELMHLEDSIFQEWSDGKRDYTSIKYKYLSLKNSTPKVDIFGFARLGIDLYITNKFKEAIVNAKLTGFEINEQRRVHLLQ